MHLLFFLRTHLHLQIRQKLRPHLCLNPAQKFLKSDRAIQLYEEIIEKIVSYSNTSYAKNRILLLAPIKDEEIIEERLNFVMNAKEKVSELPLYELDKLMKHLHEPKQSKPNYDAWFAGKR